MAIATFTEEPYVIPNFCRIWGITQLYTKPIVVRCLGCAGTLRLAMATDTPMEARDCQVFLTLELWGRGWHINRPGAPRCPRCGLPG